MTQDEHPTEEALSAYAETGDGAAYSDVVRHLTGCVPCRKKAAALRQVVVALRARSLLDEELPEGQGHLSEETIADYVEGDLGTREREAAKAHIDACPACLASALHYAGHTEAMREALGAARPVGAAPPAPESGPVSKLVPHAAGKRSNPLIDGIKRLFAVRLPVGIAVPATVAATALLALTIWPGGPGTDGSKIQAVVYQDAPVVTFAGPGGTPPGIGFFGQARERTEPFDGIRVRVEKDSALSLSWLAISGAERYRLTLYRAGPGGERSEVARVETEETDARITVETEPGRRYEWHLSGTTGDEGTFEATGGFVMAPSRG